MQKFSKFQISKKYFTKDFFKKFANLKFFKNKSDQKRFIYNIKKYNRVRSIFFITFKKKIYIFFPFSYFNKSKANSIIFLYIIYKTFLITFIFKKFEVCKSFKKIFCKLFFCNLNFCELLHKIH